MELIGKAFLIQPSEIEIISGSNTKRRPKNLSLEELLKIAEDRGLGDFYGNLTSALEAYLVKKTNRSSLAFYGKTGDGWRSIISLIPTQSSQEEGLKFQVYISRFVNYFKTEHQTLISNLPENKEDWKYYPAADTDYSGCIGYFQKEEEVNKFITWLNTLKGKTIAQ